MAEAQKRLAREYETIYLLKAETPDDQVDDIKERLRAVVTREGGKVIRFTNQGKRKTAFPVAKTARALYMHCLYLGSPGIVAEFERNLKMLDVVAKFQSVKIADGIDMESRQVEQDVKVAPVEEDAAAPKRDERPEFGERAAEEPFADVAGEE
jgi:small subunit ribosomal protein S6